jgi:hypothetical protein
MVEFSDLRRAALKLFSSVDEALEFLKDRKLEEARVKLLTELDRVLEAAEIHAKNRKLVQAIETLSASTTRSAKHEQQMIEYLLRGLRRGFTLGMTPTPSTSPTLFKLLALVDRLDESATAGQGFDEVRSPRPYGGWALHSYTSSLQCFKQSRTLTMQPSAHLPRLSSGQEMSQLLCCA